MIKIQPIEIPTKGIAKYFSIKCLQIDLKKSSEAAPSFYWEVKKAVPYAIAEVQIEIAGLTLLEGELHMTTAEYAEWSNDDSYVINWALAKLGFTEDTSEETSEIAEH